MFKYSYLFLLITLCTSCHNNEPSSTDQVVDNQPKIINYSVVQVYPHDTSSYIEGFFIQNDSLFESGKTFITISDVNSLKVLKKINLPANMFGEGSSILNGKLYQLTYTEHKIIVYDAKSFIKTGEYDWPMEGWGMTTDGKSLIVSTGDSNLYYLNPDNLKVEKTVGVSDNYGPVANINELEYVDGFVYANIFEQNTIIKIDANSGNVVGFLNCDNINKNNGINYTPGSINGNDLMNGISYNRKDSSFLITGKNWPKIFKIKLSK